MKFCTAVNCMDGRVQIPVVNYLKERFGVEYVDMITEPGPNGILAAQEKSALVQSVLDRIDISVNKHGSKHIAVIGHHDCAGNPVDKNRQERDTRKAVEFLQGKFAGIEVIGLWVGPDWTVSEIFHRT